MGHLINIQNGQAVTTSRQVAENFGKVAGKGSIYFVNKFLNLDCDI